MSPMTQLRGATAALAALVWVQVACTTIIPKHVTATTASFDGGEQTSGVIGFNPDGTIAVTSHFRARYNALIALYGAAFAPPVTPDAGVQARGVLWAIDKQHFVYFETMNRWRKEGRPPAGQARP